MFSQVIIIALAALPFVAQSATAADCARSYTIQEGDICDSISAAKNVSTYQLAVINTPKIDTQCTNLIPGDSICLGYLGEDCTETYVVQTDDTCEGITGQAGLNSTILTLNNPQIDQDCSNLYIGEVLCTAKSVQVPPAPASGKPIAPTTAKPATPKATNDDDDDDLPYCDEL